MKKKLLYAFCAALFIAAVFFGVYYVTCYIQPKEFSLGTKDDVPVESYIDPNTTYYLSGQFECYPKVIIAPQNFDNYNEACTVIESLNEIRSEACEYNGNYVATIRFYIKAPTDVPYGIIFPGEYCEYIIFANRQTVSYSTTFRSDTPVYASPKYFELPASETGEYEIIMYIITPVNSEAMTNGTILFGSADKMSSTESTREVISIVLCAVIIATILFSLIQLVAMSREKVLVSFVLFGVATLFRIMFSSDVIVMSFIPNLPYQLGTIIKGLTMPAMLLSLIYHTYCLYPSLFKRNITIFVSILQVLPLINSMTLRTLPVLEILTYISYTCAFTLCYYVFIKACEYRYPYNNLYGVGLALTSVGGLTYVSTKGFAIPAPYMAFYPFVVFTILKFIILAKRYADQKNAEIYYTEELNRTLEAMQASESAFLNAQMKPHFLYNTLNTIADLCVSDPAKAIKLINSLEDYLRLILSIDNMERTVPLSQEMQLVTAYSSIEKERFPSINFYTDLPIRMPRVEIPPLTLQPLIENAIKHGVRKSDRPGAITLRIRDSYDSVTFYVSDNGSGMSEETIAKLFEQPKENKSIGVYNIDKRLKNLYKQGLTVESTIGLGTCVSFSVPK